MSQTKPFFKIDVPFRPEVIEKVRTRTPRMISPSCVRRFMLDHARKTRAHKFTRVSADTLAQIEGRVREYCACIVERAPSKGVTL